MRRSFDAKSLSGNYLASEFAQRHHDWNNASAAINRVMKHDPHDAGLKRRAMILAMGAGEYDRAIAIATGIKEHNDTPLTYLFLAADAFKKKNYQQASELINTMPAGSLSEFMMPLLRSWSKAGLGELDVSDLNGNTLHIYHRILIMNFLGEKDGIEDLITQSITARGLTVDDVKRIADAYASIGKTEEAKELYRKILLDQPNSIETKKKLEALTNGTGTDFLLKIISAENGISTALYDMALLLFQEDSDESARVFAHLALFLNPELTQSKMLLAGISGRNDQPLDAIRHYASIAQDSPYFLESSRIAADLLEDMDDDKKALSVLQTLYNTHKDVDALIQIGDIHRRNDDFDKAIKSYNTAADTLGTIGPDYWHLHYLRGIAYEQNKQWTKAEKDLTTALEFQPDHPLVLNYLGYSWADQGLNLETSLELIRKAAAQQSSDGYIIDSLGWVLYRMGRYEEAVPHLERAVKMVPYDPIINDHLGDAYWQVGRAREARFQWLRTKNHTEDETLKASVEEKLQSGLKAPNAKSLKIVNETQTPGKKIVKQ